jgi:hypothetical protein
MIFAYGGEANIKIVPLERNSQFSFALFGYICRYQVYKQVPVVAFSKA